MSPLGSHKVLEGPFGSPWRPLGVRGAFLGSTGGPWGSTWGPFWPRASGQFGRVPVATFGVFSFLSFLSFLSFRSFLS